MFFQKIYSSWKDIQEKKYEQIIKTLSKSFFKGKILDIGAGNCYFEEFLHKNEVKAEIVCTDTDKNALTESKLKSAKVMADGNNLPFKQHSFDIIISFDTMHLIKTTDFKNVLKENGFVLLSIFFNEENHEDRKRLLKDKLSGFKTIREFEIPGKENEYVILAKKMNN